MLRVVRELFNRLTEIQGTLNSDHAMLSQLWGDKCKACLAREAHIEFLKMEIERLHKQADEQNQVLLRALKLDRTPQPIVHSANDLQGKAGVSTRNWGKVRSALEEKYKQPAAHADEVESYWKKKNAEAEAGIPELVEALAKEEKDLA